MHNQKLRLNVEELSIESFVITDVQLRLRGTIRGAEITDTGCEPPPEETKAHISCLYPCDGMTLGYYTCGANCNPSPTIE